MGSHSGHQIAKLDEQDPPWMSEAACYDEGFDDFFPKRGGSVHRREDCNGVERLGPDGAGVVIPQCAVKEECLEYALVNKIRFGIWGGTTADQRSQMLRGTPKQRRLRAVAEPMAFVPQQLQLQVVTESKTG